MGGRADRTIRIDETILSNRGLHILREEQQPFGKTQVQEHRLAELRDAQPFLREGILDSRRLRVEDLGVHESEVLKARYIVDEDATAHPLHRTKDLLIAERLVRKD